MVWVHGCPIIWLAPTHQARRGFWCIGANKALRAMVCPVPEVAEVIQQKDAKLRAAAMAAKLSYMELESLLQAVFQQSH